MEESAFLVRERPAEDDKCKLGGDSAGFALFDWSRVFATEDMWSSRVDDSLVSHKLCPFTSFPSLPPSSLAGRSLIPSSIRGDSSASSSSPPTLQRNPCPRVNVCKGYIATIITIGIRTIPTHLRRRIMTMSGVNGHHPEGCRLLEYLLLLQRIRKGKRNGWL